MTLFATTPALHVHADPSGWFIAVALVVIVVGPLLAIEAIWSHFEDARRRLDRRLFGADDEHVDYFPDLRAEPFDYDHPEPFPVEDEEEADADLVHPGPYR